MPTASKLPAVQPQVPAASGTSTLSAGLRSLNLAEISIPLAVLGIILAMIMPLPAFLLDVLISANITLSVIVLLVSLYIVKPVDFSVFPTTLLLMTLFRLALNISSARLILLNGNTGIERRGRGHPGIRRLCRGRELRHRRGHLPGPDRDPVRRHQPRRGPHFGSDGALHPGRAARQADVDRFRSERRPHRRSGARARRKQLAPKRNSTAPWTAPRDFTQRDAVASILITAINIIAGFLIGVLQHGMELKRALETYTVLTIGDGLVTVIPALMISISGGLIVTRASSETKLGQDFRKQVFSSSQPLLLASGVLIAMAAFPGLPKIPFLMLGAGVGRWAGVCAKKLSWQKKRRPLPPQPRKTWRPC